MSKQHYVYLHRKATDGTVFYVGKGKERRAWGRQGRNRHWKFVAQKHGFSVEIIRRDMSEPCALAFERVIIASIGLDNLANAVEGGGGITGWKHSPEAKAKISAFTKGREFTPKMRAALAAYNTNKKLTDAHKAKLSAAKAGRPRGPVPAVTRAKIAASHIGIRPSAETLKKMSLSKIGKAVGRSSHSYDHTIRTFVHPDHPDFIGTRGDFIITYGLASPCVSAVITGRQKSVKGWSLK